MKQFILLLLIAIIMSCGGTPPNDSTDTVAPKWENGLIKTNNISYTSIDLNWSGDSDNVAVTKYKLFKDDSLLNDNILTNNFGVTNLTQNTNYKFKVEACDKANNCSINGPEINVKTLKEEIQNEAPVWIANAKIEGSEITTNSVKLSWSEAVDDVNIKEYVLYKNNIELKRLTERITTVDSLTHNTNYTFKVIACDDFSLCTQPIEVEIKTIKENEAPVWAANAKIEATDIQLFQTTVKWDFATDDFGISKYILYINGNKYNEFDINVSETTIAQLNKNTNYTFKIEALDTHGLETTNGPFVTIKTLNYPPVPQWNDEFIEVIEKGRSGVLLYFRGAVDDNEVTGYKIYQNGTLVKTTGIETTFVKITGLMPNTNYTFKVEAIDIDNNESTDGPSIDVLTNNDIPQTLGEIPELDPTKVTHIFEATSFLYDGLNPIQMGIDPKIIDRDRVSVIRGRVLNDNNEPIQGVLVKMLHNGKFGYTYTRDDGWFDMVVNGGGTFVIDYQKEGLLTVQRKMETQINDYFIVDDIVMIPYDPISNEIINNSNEVQIIKGTTQTDSDGTRTATLFVPKNTIAKMKMPNGEYQELTTFHARATEYTVGENGVKRMPAELPANTGYTYAVELSVDEAEEVGATTVEFNQNLYFYLENFLNFDTGIAVPTGYYDKDKAIWIAQQDGVVVNILNIDENNLVSLDINGDGVPEDFEMLEKLGFTEDELDFIAVNYQIGQNLWRVPIKHFSPWDCNWP